MKITITGATGFVGKNLKDYLETSHEINPINVRYVPNQEFELKGHAIIHLAGKAHDLKKVSNPQDYYEANFELTKQLFDAFLDSEAKVFIFMSTVKAVADTVDGVLTEDTVQNPKTHYGKAKYQAEQYILSKELPSDKRVYILRPCMIHGPGNKGNLNLLYKLAVKGFPWPLGAFENKRSFLTVENLCFIIKELLENKDVASGVYHLADDESLSTNELMELMGKCLERKSVIWKIPSVLVVSISKLGDYLYLPLNSERLDKLTESYLVSNIKIKKAIQKELPVSAKEGFVNTIKSFK
nr:NAD-dependent epimerase/dehydratase family protein [uncultured Flavobacterium sp.]